MNKLAQINFHDGTGYRGFGALGLETGNVDSAGNVFTSFITSLIGIISIVAIIWFVVIVITSGIAYMGAGPDQKAAEAAKKRITNGLIGLLIAIFGIFLVRLAGQILNIPNILNVGNLITDLEIK